MLARALILGLGVAGATLLRAAAATLAVDTTNDTVAADGLLSLREAVLAANLTGGVDTIVLPPGVYALAVQGGGEDAAAQGDLDLVDDTVVQGSAAGPVVITAQAVTDRVFHVLASGSLTASNLNLTGGSATGGGGAILNEGRLVLGDCALYGNAAAYGGAVFNVGTAALLQVTLADNSAARGGALLASNGVVEVRHASVANNAASSGSGGGLAAAPGAAVTLDHALVVGNVAFATGPDLDGAFISAGCNVVGLTNGWTMTGVVTNNRVQVNAPLRPLGTNGGPTLTLATVPGNPAIDAGSAAFGGPPFADQRGFARVFNGRVDAGAYEFQFPVLAVTTTDDDLDFMDDDLSLREAVVIANVQANVSNLVTLGAGTYRYTRAGFSEDNAVTGDLDLRGWIRVVGAGARQTIIDADNLDRAFYVDNHVNAQFEDLTVRGGDAEAGAGFYNQGHLTLLRCRVIENRAGVYGGGIEQWTGSLWVYQSLLAGNACETPGGGAIDMLGGTAVVVSSTISGNSSPVGAGIYRYGGQLELYFTSVAANQGTTIGGGLYAQGAAEAVFLQGSVFADNTAASGADVAGLVDSLGHNFVEDYSASTGYVETDLGGGDPQLLALGDYGGPTESHVPARGSALINRGDPAVTNGFDQRGFPRVRGRAMDIGSTEEQTPDEDLDGMPDEWEAAFGLNATNAADGAVDGDGDGVANAAEFLADTVPTNAQSYLRITGAELAASPGSVTFPSSTARVYRLQAAADTASAWQDAGSPVTGQVGNTVLDAGPATNARALRVTAWPP